MTTKHRLQSVHRSWARVAVLTTLLWFFFTVLPVVLLSPRGLDGVVAKQWGESARLYLRFAPAPLVLHLLLARWVAWFTLPLLAFTNARPGRGGAEATGWWGALAAVATPTAVWCGVWFLGVAAVGAVAIHRGAPADVALGFATQLGGFGLLTILPLWAAIFVVGQLVRKRWAATLALVLGALAWALVERVLDSSGSTLPLPGLLLRRLLSGDAEEVQQAFWSSWYITVAGLLVAVLGSVLSSRRARPSESTAISG